MESISQSEKVGPVNGSSKKGQSYTWERCCNVEQGGCITGSLYHDIVLFCSPGAKDQVGMTQGGKITLKN